MIMGVVFSDRKSRTKGTVNDQRREKKKRTDMLRKKTGKNELKVVFNTVYRDQVSALYQAVTKGKN